MVGQGKLLKVFFEEMNETIEPSLEPSLRKLRSLYYPHSEDTFLASERLSQSLFLWDTFSLSRLEVLLRFKGIQLFMSSICSGVSVDDDLLNPTERRGAFSPLLKHLYEGETHPDIQFWKQSADPILAHDPFSSLMWVLFCIPLPFVLSSDFFFPLVHLFYVVCVVQALLTCYNQENFDTSGFNDYVLHDICSTMSESGFVRQYFTSKYIDPSCHPKDMVRRFTFPYLRRDEVVRDLALNWCQHFCKEFKARRYRGALFSSPAVSFKLMQLPLVYQDLLQRYVKMHCSECESVPDEPALCLLCGKLCSPNWKSCCRASKCLNHVMVCGAGVGVFLLVRDHDMYRGKPLYLSEERYAALTYLVASHSLD
uniref:E3 ubiquitin-protein ligase n=1 Tax=Ananas comosus var. bracteatus TaxID=296719 RepID=A0A6V7PEQ1_ANACO|nr:unnamed protein product [Ananas comosus var. bracteatus]